MTPATQRAGSGSEAPEDPEDPEPEEVEHHDGDPLAQARLLRCREPYGVRRLSVSAPSASASAMLPDRTAMSSHSSASRSPIWVARSSAS